MYKGKKNPAPHGIERNQFFQLAEASKYTYHYQYWIQIKFSLDLSCKKEHLSNA